MRCIASMLVLAALACVAAAPADSPRPPLVADKVAPAVAPAVQPFDLADVRLLDSPFKEAQDKNAAYLLQLEPDRFLHYFRTEAGLEPKAAAYGGWESPTTGAGRCLGHYLSALSLQYRSSGDPRFKQRVDYITDELALCQQPTGYLAAAAGFKDAFAALAQGNATALTKTRVPWYIEHKLFAGLRDAWQLTGNTKARDVLLKLADWAIDVTKNLTDEQFQTMLNQEQGGIQEVLADVYALTGEKKYLTLAQRFDHHAVTDPLAHKIDALARLHANTQIPKVIGAARLYELTGAQREKTVAEFFWTTVVAHHTYALGGNSDGEAFDPADQLSNHLHANSAETCNTYNMLKLTRHLIALDPQVAYADYYESALYNHILASIGPEPGNFTYYVSLLPGHFKIFSKPFDCFWCCVGTGMENHTKYADSIYFHNDDSLYVNLFIPSEVHWAAKNATVTMTTDFPASDTIHLKVSAAAPTSFRFRIRYPAYAGMGATVSRNHAEFAPITTGPGDYITLNGEWHDGDTLDLKIPIGLRTQPMADDPNKIAIFYGPLLLAGDLGPVGIPQASADLLPRNAAAKDPPVPTLSPHGPLTDWLKPVADHPLTFRTSNAANPGDVTLIPFYKTVSDHYTIYWDIKK